MRLSDLAALAGVSTSTVSRALSGHPSVNTETQRRIQAMAREHDVRPNQLARNLRLRSTGAVGLAIPLRHVRRQHLTDPFFLALLGFLADQLVARGYDILLSRVHPDEPDWLDRLIDSGRIDGLVLVGQSDQYETIERVAERGVPLVVWGAHRPGQRHVTVGSDNIEGGRMAARHLIERGRRRFLFVGNTTPPEFADRLAGFREEANANGLAVDLLPTPATDPDAVHAAMRARLAEGDLPDAIFAATDVAAIAVLRAFKDAGIDVPGTASVIGYDDVTLAPHTTPPLTTVRQDVQRGVELMVDRLIHLIEGRPTEHAIVPPDLIVRQST